MGYLIVHNLFRFEMPASRSYRPRNYNDLEFRVSGDLKWYRSVYFTDRHSKFTIHIKNNGEKEITGSTFCRLSFINSSRSYEYDETVKIEFDLGPGEYDEKDLDVEMFPYQGSAALSLDTIQLTHDNGKVRQLRTRDRRYRVYTFMVYDRDYYRINYQLPRWAQYAAMILSVLIVASALIQIYVLI